MNFNYVVSFKNAGFFTNRINRSVESNCGRIMRHDSASLPFKSRHRRSTFSSPFSSFDTERYSFVPFRFLRHHDLCFLSLREYTAISEILWRNDDRLHHEDPGRHVASPPAHAHSSSPATLQLYCTQQYYSQTSGFTVSTPSSTWICYC